MFPKNYTNYIFCQYTHPFTNITNPQCLLIDECVTCANVK